MSMRTKNVLKLDYFTGKNNKVVTISIIDPKDDLTSIQVQTAMERLAELNAFTPFYEGPVSLKGAKTVQTVTNSFDITVS